MSAALCVAFICNLAGALLVLGFGLVYLLRREFMPYHAVAVGRTWMQLEPPVRVLFLAMLRGVGGISLAVAFLELTLLFFALREGIAWALWAAPIGGIMVSATALHAMTMVRRHTPARPPWVLGIAACVLHVTALCAALQVLHGANPFLPR